jgi:hypothetical protein
MHTDTVQADRQASPCGQGFLTVVRAVGMRNKNRAVNRTNRAVNCCHWFDKFGLILFIAIFLNQTAAV